MPAIGGNFHVSYSWTATWLQSPRSVPVLEVGRRASLATMEWKCGSRAHRGVKGVPDPRRRPILDMPKVFTGSGGLRDYLETNHL